MVHVVRITHYKMQDKTTDFLCH